MATMVSI